MTVQLIFEFELADTHKFPIIIRPTPRYSCPTLAISWSG